jgi:hypothetical protein
MSYPGRFSKLSELPTIASATTITPYSELVQVSGTTAIDTITVPATGGFSTALYVVPTGIFTWTTNGNIGLAGTAVVGKLIVFVYSKVAGKWYPSVVA